MRIEIELKPTGKGTSLYRAHIKATGDKGTRLLDFHATIKPTYGKTLLSSLLRSFADKIADAEAFEEAGRP